MSDLSLIETNPLHSLEVQSKQGGVPLLEVAKLVKKHGPVLAGNVYTAYENDFGPTTRATREGFINKDQVEIHESELFVGKKERKIGIYITPPEVQENNYALAIYPKVMFFYTQTPDGKWQYDSATVHMEEGGGYIDIKSIPEPHTAAHRSFWNTRIQMADLERTLGKYLHQP